VAPSSSPSPQPSQRLEPPLPAAREEGAAAALGSRLYVVGGFDAEGGDSSSVFIFDGVTWAPGPALPQAVDHVAAAVAGGRLYVAGGFHGGSASAEVFVLAPTGLSWDTAPPMQRPRGALALVGWGDLVYAIGGRGPSGEVAVPEVYDPASRTWSNLPPLPQPRDHLAGFAIPGGICVAGGVSPATARVDCLYPSPQRWGRLPDLPQATRGPGAAGMGSAVVVAGGEDGTEVHLVDQVSRWRSAWVSEPMLVPRHGFELAPFGGRIWACGGGSAAGLHPVSTCTSLLP
jgi:hypothetical protein